MKKDKVMDLFVGYLREKVLQITKQREEIFRCFLSTDTHLSVEELYSLVRKKDPKVGQTTVFRTLKLLCEADIAKEVDFGGRVQRYEVKYGHKHHDHLVCTKCGEFIEAVDERIEELQDKLCKKFGFIPF